jgi:hypothetical protein
MDPQAAPDGEVSPAGTSPPAKRSNGVGSSPSGSIGGSLDTQNLSETEEVAKTPLSPRSKAATDVVQATTEELGVHEDAASQEVLTGIREVL